MQVIRLVQQALLSAEPSPSPGEWAVTVPFSFFFEVVSCSLGWLRMGVDRTLVPLPLSCHTGITGVCCVLAHCFSFHRQAISLPQLGFIGLRCHARLLFVNTVTEFHCSPPSYIRVGKKWTISAVQRAGRVLATEAELSGCIWGCVGWICGGGGVFESAESSGFCGLWSERGLLSTAVIIGGYVYLFFGLLRRGSLLVWKSLSRHIAYLYSY